MTPEEAAALVRPSDAIGLGLITGTPTAMLRALSARTDWEDLTLSGGLLLGNYELFTHPNVHLRATFYGGAERNYVTRGGDVQFIPSYFRHYGLLIQHLKPRVMITPASMPDEHGRVSLSLYNGAHLEEHLRAARDPERLLIVECSPHFPRTLALEGHENFLSLDDVDVVVYTAEHPTQALPRTRGSRSSLPPTCATARPCRPASGPSRTWSPRRWCEAAGVTTACTQKCSPTGSIS